MVLQVAVMRTSVCFLVIEIEPDHCPAVKAVVAVGEIVPVSSDSVAELVKLVTVLP